MSKMRRRLLGMMNTQSNWYVTDGLLLHMDGIEKGATANAWTSLVGGHVFTPAGGVTFNADNVEFDGVDGMLTNNTFTVPSANSGTIEIVFEKVDGNIGKTLFMPTSGSKRLCIYINSSNIMLWSNYSASPRYSVPSTASVSVNANGCFANGKSVTMDGSDFIASASTSINRIGCRYSSNGNTNFYNGKIYCIRIYSRLLTQAEVFHNLAIDRKRFGIGYPTT